MVHPDDLPGTVAAWSAAIASGAEYEHEHRLRMADGTYRWHLSRGIAMPAPGGDGTLWYGTATDIHAVRDAEDRLRRTQSALALAMRGGKIGWWQRDLRTEEVTWSPELEELFGLPGGAFEGDEGAFLARVHPDDRPAVSAAVASAIESGNDYVIEFRFVHADGSWRWMEGRGRATYEDGRPTVLPKREFLLLRHLMRNPDVVCSRQELLSEVWGYDFDPSTNVVDVCVGRLRSKIRPDLIVTVRNVGYQLQSA